MAGKGKGKVASSKAPKVAILTKNRCLKCGQLIFTNEMTSLLSIDWNENGNIRRRMQHFHKACR